MPKFDQSKSPLHSRRGFLAGLFLAGASAAPAFANPGRLRTVLFVCQFGTVKSAVAREVCIRRARERGISLRIISRGISPLDHVSDSLRARLLQDRLDAALAPITQLDQATLNAADIVILFDRLPPSLIRADARDWTEMPSLNGEYDRARAFLDPRIERLLNELA